MTRDPIPAAPTVDPRNPPVKHYRGGYGAVCGLRDRDLDGVHHRAVDYSDDEADCSQCLAYAVDYERNWG